MSEHYDYPLLQLILKVFYFFKVKFKYYKDDVTDVSIQFNCFNKKETCECSETVTIYIFPVFIKLVVFYHVGLYWMILTKEQYEFAA